MNWTQIARYAPLVSLGCAALWQELDSMQNLPGIAGLCQEPLPALNPSIHPLFASFKKKLMIAMPQFYDLQGWELDNLAEQQRLQKDFAESLAISLELVEEYFKTHAPEGVDPFKSFVSPWPWDETIPLTLVWSQTENPASSQNCSDGAALKGSSAMASIGIVDLPPDPDFPGFTPQRITVTFQMKALLQYASDIESTEGAFRTAVLATTAHEIIGHLSLMLAGRHDPKERLHCEQVALCRTADFLDWIAERVRQNPDALPGITVEQLRQALLLQKNGFFALKRCRG